MPPRKEYWTFINDEETFFKYYNDDNKKLSVLDIHPHWSGACELMYPTYKSLGTMIEDFDKRINFFIMDYEVIKNCQKIKLDRFGTILTKHAQANPNSYSLS